MSKAKPCLGTLVTPSSRSWPVSILATEVSLYVSIACILSQTQSLESRTMSRTRRQKIETTSLSECAPIAGGSGDDDESVRPCMFDVCVCVYFQHTASESCNAYIISEAYKFETIRTTYIAFKAYEVYKPYKIYKIV